jgi:hypothetical protein
MVVPLLMVSVSGLAQQTSGSIAGVVQDSAGAMVPGATVELVNQLQGEGSRRTMQSTSDGTFAFTPLQTAVYTLTVTISGFKKYVQSDITLNAADRLSIPVVLQLGTLTETVEVQAQAVQLQTQSAERSGVVTGTQIVDIALNGRSWSSLLNLVPGVLNGGNVNGLRSDENNETVDGITNMDAGSNGNDVVAVNIDTIAEVKVLTNSLQAEYGKAAGGGFELVTKGGSRDVHGDVYWFHRNEGLNANSWRNNTDGLQKSLYRYLTAGFTAGGPVYIPKKFNRNRDRLFFFVAEEWNHQLSPASITTLLLPTAAERQGDFSLTHNTDGSHVTIKDPLSGAPFPNNQIPQNRFNSYGQNILNFYPLPNVSGNPSYNYESEFPATVKNLEGVYRVDYNITDKWRLFGRMVTNKNVDIIPYGSPYGNNCQNNLGLGAGFDTGYRNFGAMLNLTTVIGPTLTNEFIFGFAHRNNYCVPEDNYAPYLESKTGINFPQLYPNADSLGITPNLYFGGITNSPWTHYSGLPYFNVPENKDLADHVSKVFARHIVKAGIYWLANIKYQVTTAWTIPQIHFDRDSANPGDTNWDYSNALLGNFDYYYQDATFPLGHYKFNNVEWYVQDNWKVSSKLTLDYGMRFSYIPPWYEFKNEASTFNPALYNPAQAVTLYAPALNASGQRVAVNPLTGAFSPAAFIGAIVPNSGNIYNGIGVGGVNGYPSGLMKGQGIEFGPRFGLAYSPDSRTVVRFGTGIFYDRVQGNPIFNSVSNPPLFSNADVYYGNLSTVSPSALTVFPTQMKGGMSEDGHIPTAYHWNFGVQRQLPGDVQLDVAYVGSIARHLPLVYQIDNPPYGSAWLPQYQDPTVTPKFDGTTTLPLQFSRPYPAYAGINLTTWGGSSNFNSLQAGVTRHMRGGLEFGVNYMWSKAMGTNESTTDSSNNVLNTRNADYGLLTTDRTHNLVANYIYTLPRVTRTSFLNNAVARRILDNWQISGITTFSSGAPSALTYSVNSVSSALLNREITGSESWAPRVVLSGSPNLSSGDRNYIQWINTSVVHPAVKGSTGMDSGREVFRGPGTNNWDMSLFKNVPFAGERRYVQLRLEAFNAFNHTQFSGLNTAAVFNTAGVLTNLPTAVGGGGGRYGFGAVNAARSNRVVQIAAKLYF